MIHRWKLLTILVWTMLGVGALLLVTPQSWFPSFYNPHFMGVSSLIFGILILLPEVTLQPKNERQHEARAHLQITFGVCLALSGAGELGLWQLYLIGFQYDKFTHVVIPALLTFSFARFIEEWYRVTWRRALLGVAIGVFVVSIAWEGIEFYSDRIFGTQLFGVYGTQVSLDTVLDLIANGIGISVGALVYWSKKSLPFF